MKILILGGEGMLGHKAFQLLRNRFDTYATFRETDGSWQHQPIYAQVNRDCLLDSVDATNLATIKQALDQVKPNTVINCIGIVKQRNEAMMAIPAIQINALFPHQLADICETIGARLIHISTDCVFSGQRGRYTERDTPDPVDLYGRSKLLGELNRPGCLTLRTSMIGWELKRYVGLVEWFAAQRGHAIKGYCRAIYSGLTTTVLVELIGELIKKHPTVSGLYQVASQPIDKYGLLVRLRDTLGWRDITIEPDDLFQCDRSLDGTRFEVETGWRALTWDKMITDLANEWQTYELWRRDAK